jgi:C-terminal peptidase prc
MHPRKRTGIVFCVCLALSAGSSPLLEEVGWRSKLAFSYCHAFRSPFPAGRSVLSSETTRIQTSSRKGKISLTVTTLTTMKMHNNPSEIDAHSRYSSSTLSIDRGKSSSVETTTAIPRVLRSFLLSLSLLLSTATTPLTLHLLPIPLSIDTCWAMSPEQLLVDDVWREVSRQFVDPTFAGQGEEGWRNQRLQALQKVSKLGPDEDQQVYSIIRTMLASLHDPYTRFLTPEQFESLINTYATPSTSKALSSGIGVQLIGDNGKGSSGGMVVVANIVPNSPAEKSGILPGDIIRSIDGVDMTGATAEAVAAKCRGGTGTLVEVQIERSGGKPQTFSVIRAVLPETPLVEASVVIPNGASRLGVLKINSFTPETEKKVEEEMKKWLEGKSPVSAIVLDLRGNVGGYMPAGVDVAKLFLPGNARIISVSTNECLMVNVSQQCFISTWLTYSSDYFSRRLTSLADRPYTLMTV